ncbi:1,5-anhydro-D-fructose reductase-like isoform X2 [Mizuhopecten yessoensis]|uniref:1,5-anhydro-D-fructose reductase n=2 Tax=Mizuhopecten yessoensis TaxID=6573 RepID=A0A210QC13_MIZYE|nr:1,5-anhydro-D-fructose reductase-like isoform X2 [Mizuhopecten yessoensis]XP_021362154.1 1,5-anhydro-D-fructose reductase-like isoform X2 [Mizuhopecten yessoensis]XP_021362155.1 1,5-anhydro-D-fructose reductase-like isoform X2 [Mizuhopecten yessoensis]XP_021362156.1 1,5-anhydro-D-fructose reductase-like isoform X2 [Mizuhopecten yessoensis]OWF46273.1 1,5-anhydro-D-fructose reductase [Mizuhopecten yessoensis]
MAKVLSLSNGKKIPQIGLGTSRIPKDILEDTVCLAIEKGYRHFDTAFAYYNEVEIGNALKRKFEDGTVKRDELFVTSKLSSQYQAEEDVCPACTESLRRLQLDYVDLFLIHSPLSLKNPGYFATKPVDTAYLERDLKLTWRAMEELVFSGKAKSIGLSNFNSQQIDYISQGARIKPVMNQVELNIRFPQYQLERFCAERGILLTAYAPMGAPGHPKLLNTKDKVPLLMDPNIIKLAEKYGKNQGQILLKSLVERNVVLIPMSTNPDRLTSNLQLYDFELSKEDSKLIAGLEDGIRHFRRPTREDHPDYPFLISF